MTEAQLLAALTEFEEILATLQRTLDRIEGVVVRRIAA
jgi:hypothetical protein